jgi:hypothetical protein
MSNRHNRKQILGHHAINQKEREFLRLNPAMAIIDQRPPLRVFSDLAKRAVDSGEEATSCPGASACIPRVG